MDASPVCCDGFSEMQYKDVQFYVPEIAKLNKKSPTFVFEESKKNYFSAYRLPDYPVYFLLLESLLRRANGYHANPGWLYVAPKVLLLDERFNVMQSVEPELKVDARNGFSMDGLLKLTSQYKYMIVYPAKGFSESVGELDARPQLKTIYSGKGLPTFYTDPGSKSTLGTTPKGKVRLTFIDPFNKPEQPSADSAL